MVERTGRIDILVNNAGFADYSVIENMSMETFDRTVEHYLRTPFVLTQAAIPHMRAQGRVDRQHRLGDRAGPGPAFYRDYNKSSGDVLYASMKAALHRFSQGWRRNWWTQHRRQRGRSVECGAHPGSGRAHPRHVPHRAGRVSGRDGSGDVPSSGGRAHRSGRVQPALPVVAAGPVHSLDGTTVLPPLEPLANTNPNILPAGI